jgi:hypothetical protein
MRILTRTGKVRIRAMLSAILVSHLLGVTLVGADLPGTWKLNLSKSISQTDYASDVVKIQETGSLTYLFTYDVTLKRGEKFHSQAVRIFDGKTRQVDKDSAEVNEHPDSLTWISTRLKSGKITDRREAVVAPDNKSHTVKRRTLTADGQRVEELMVFDRQ